MKATRREMLQVGVAAACAMSVGAANGPGAGKSDAVGPMAPLDYGRSFICNTAALNAVRFWVESRTRVIDDKAGTSTDYYQCGACKSEDTFAERNLFKKDNYDFTPILGGDRWLIFRRPAGLSGAYRSVVQVEKVWGKPVLNLREVPEAAVLETWEQIRDATAAAIPIVTQTDFANAETGLRAVIECPTKTMNVNLEKKLYQVDTGPVAFPDLAKRYEPEIDCLKLAFIAFNTPGFADFVVEQPTPVIVDGAAKCEVYHYSNPFSLTAKNRVLALRDAGRA